MKMNKILLVVALLVSARAFAFPGAALAKNGFAACSKTAALVATKTGNGVSLVCNHIKAMPAVLKKAGTSVAATVKTYPKIAIATTVAVAAVTALAFLSKTVQTRTRAKEAIN
jgi:uncharacterized protein (UPF0261 family)